ncbi:MAG: hypothetical protein NC293_02170 [Roseburia sp.]|nr:hypothetical protein [Roseburia sp.]
MIVIDTSLLRQLASTAKSTNEEIGEAVNLLQQVATHNNWGCAERHQINEFTQQNKNKIRQIQEAGTNFYHTILSVSNDFESLEKQFPSMFNEVDSVLGNILSISIPGSAVLMSSNMTKMVKKILSNVSGKQSNTKSFVDWKAIAKKLTTGIQVTDFKSLELSGRKSK